MGFVERFPMHHFLIAVSPVLSMYAANVSKVEFSDLIGAIGVTILTTALLWCLTYIVAKDWRRASLPVTTFLVAIFLSGYVIHASTILSTELKGPDAIIGWNSLRPLLIALIGLMLFIAFPAVSYVVTYRLKDTKSWTALLNVGTLCLVVIPILSAAYGSIYANRSPLSAINPSIAKESKASASLHKDDQPNIYYIILDGYARADVLKQIYGYDNGPFLNRLKEMGFYIADKSTANYCQTYLSLASSLNLSYLDKVTRKVKRGRRSEGVAIKMMKNSRVMRFLKERGYQVASFATGIPPTEFRHADVFLSPHHTPEFFFELLKSPPLMLFNHFLSNVRPIQLTHNRQRTRILFSLENLSKFAGSRIPTFVFCHVVCPHPPFVFDSKGVLWGDSTVFEFSDANRLHKMNKRKQNEYVYRYAAQVSFLNSKLEEALVDVLTKSRNSPVIVLQSDHGPGAMLDWDNPTPAALKERLAILNTYYVKEDARNDLYESITPVNTFRLILHYYFGAGLPLLKDESFYSTWNEPFKFIPVAKEVLGGTTYHGDMK